MYEDMCGELGFAYAALDGHNPSDTGNRAEFDLDLDTLDGLLDRWEREPEAIRPERMGRPRVSVGMPVYNGARYVGQAIESVLGQTCSDLELIVSDNGSTDATPSICRDYADRDHRVVFVRSEENRGATWNFNRVAALARGTYFRWAAADDVIDPEYLRRCLEVLDSDPSVVLCHSAVRLIGPDGATLELTSEFDDDFRSPTPSTRFAALLRGRKCFEIFGLMRTDVLRKLPPMGAYGHADGVLLSRIGLCGTLHEIAGHLFGQRVHPEQSMNVYGSHTGGDSESDGPPDYLTYASWFDPALVGKRSYPYWRILAEDVRSAIATPGVSVTDRAACAIIVLRSIRHRRWYLGHDLKLAIGGRGRVRTVVAAETPGTAAHQDPNRGEVAVG
jgi:glycosyltransferase involved in cell wall biosynthesis